MAPFPTDGAVKIKKWRGFTQDGAFLSRLLKRWWRFLRGRKKFSSTAEAQQTLLPVGEQKKYSQTTTAVAAVVVAAAVVVVHH